MPHSVGILLLAGAGAWGLVLLPQKSPMPASSQTQQIPTPPLSPEREAETKRLIAEITRDPADRMMLDYKWQIGGFGNIGILTTATVDNQNDVEVRDITLRCTFSGASGTRLSEVNATIYDKVPPKKKRTFKDVNMGVIHPQSKKASCLVVSGRKPLQ